MATKIYQLEANENNINGIGISLLTPSTDQSYFSPSTDYIEYVVKSNTSGKSLVNYNFKGIMEKLSINTFL